MPATAAPIPLAQESIYNLIPPQAAPRAATSMYRSKHADSAAVPPTFSTFGFLGTSKLVNNVAGHTELKDPEPHPAIRKCATFGRVVSDTIDPKSYLLRSSATHAPVCGNLAMHPDGSVGAAGGSRHAAASVHSRAVGGAAVESTTRKDRTLQMGVALREAVPLRTEKPVMGLSSGTDFVARNAREVQLPKGGATACAVGQGGAASATVTTSHGQRAVDRRDFGAVPAYLQGIKDELQSTKEAALQRAIDAAQAAINYDQLSREEVASLIDALTARRDDLTRHLKSMPFTMETRALLRRKEVLEGDLRAVESALATLSKKRVLVLHE